MARRYRGSDPRDVERALKAHEDQLRQDSAAISRLGKGLLPQASAPPITPSLPPVVDLSTVVLLAGRAGGQIVNGGVAVSEVLNLRGNAGETVGRVQIADTALAVKQRAVGNDSPDIYMRYGTAATDGSFRFYHGNPAFPTFIEMIPCDSASPTANAILRALGGRFVLIGNPIEFGGSSFIPSVPTSTIVRFNHSGAATTNMAEYAVGGNINSRVDLAGRFGVGVGTGTTALPAWLTVYNGSGGSFPTARFRASTSFGTGDIIEFHNATPSKVANFNTQGELTINSPSGIDGITHTRLGRTAFHGAGTPGIIDSAGIITFRDASGNVELQLRSSGTGRVEINPGGLAAFAADVMLAITAPSGGTQNLTSYRSSAGATLSGITIAGEYFLTAGAGVGKVYTSDASGIGSWQSAASPTNALLDGTNHTDTVAQAVTRGSLIVGNSTPKWDELPIGATGSLLQSNGVDAAWATTLTGDIVHTGQVTFPDETSSKYPVFSTADSGTGAGLFAVVHDATSGGDLFLYMSGTPTGNVLEIPVAGGILVTTVGSQTLQSKIFSTIGNQLRCNTSGTGVAIVDNTTTTKILRYVLSGAASGNSVFAVVNSAARTYTFPNDTGTVTLVTAPASATVDKTGQTASIGATTAYTTVHAGFYRISAYWVFTAVTVAGTLGVTAHYTDPQQAQTNNFILNTTAFGAAGAYAEGSCVMYCTSGSTIQFSTTLTNTGTYNVYIRVEALT